MGKQRPGILAAITAIALLAPVAGTTAASDSCIRPATRVLSRGCGGIGDTLPGSLETPHFFIRYDAIDGGLALEDYAEALEAAWRQMIDVLGWVPPPVYPLDPAPGGRYPVVIAREIAGGYVAFEGAHAGLVGDHPGTPWDDHDARATCMGLTGDFSAFNLSAREEMRTAVAHELFHALQAGIGALEGPGALVEAESESSAHWAVDETFGDANAHHVDIATTGCLFDPEPAGWYVHWPFYRALTEPFGAGVPGGGEDILQVWLEAASREHPRHLQVLADEVDARGGQFERQIFESQVAQVFFRPCSLAVPRPWCLEEGPSWLQLGHGGRLPHSQSLLRQPMAWGSLQAGFNSAAWLLPNPGHHQDLLVRNLLADLTLHAAIVCDRGESLEVRELPSIGPLREATHRAFDAARCRMAALLVATGAPAPLPQSCSQPLPSWTTTLVIESSVSQPEPVVLRMTKGLAAPADAWLRWTGQSNQWTVRRGPSPQSLTVLERLKPNETTDPGVIPAAPDLLFYLVQ